MQEKTKEVIRTSSGKEKNNNSVEHEGCIRKNLQPI